MDLLMRPSAKLKLVGGRLCLDFVNTVGGRSGSDITEDKLVDYSDLVAWAVHAGLVSPGEGDRLFVESERDPDIASQVFARALALREAVYQIARCAIRSIPPRPPDLERLNSELTEAFSGIRLEPGEKHYQWNWPEVGKTLDRLLWPIADSAAELLTHEDLTRLKECGGQNCGWLFLDTSKNGRRQWCDMRDCGNLAKVRKFREKQRGKKR